MTRRSILAELIGLAGWLVLSLVAAAVGALGSRDADIFYRQLVRPEWAHPASVFGPVWSGLYFLISIAAWFVWRQRESKETGWALWLFMLQLVANALWSWLFFRWHNGALAFCEMLILWVLLLCTAVAFWRTRALAGVLLLPYVVWVTFAAALCLSIWRLNPAALGG